MAATKNLEITWLGHSVAHLTTPKGTRILIDPFITGNPTYPKDYTLPENLDLLLLTHGHDDHISDALSVAQKYQPQLVGMFELVGPFGAKGVKDVVGMNLGGSYKFKDVTITLVEAHHSSSVHENGQLRNAGLATGFVLTIENAPVFYHAGDTSLFSDMQLIRDLYHPEIGMLPIGDHYTMGPKAAAMAAGYLGLKTILPIHYGTFPQLTGTPVELEEHLKGTGKKVAVPKPGETLRF